MTAPWPQQFEQFLLARGVMVADIPRRPMSRTTVPGRLRGIRVPMTELGYIAANGKNPKPIRDLTSREVIAWMEATFPDRGYTLPNKWNYHVRALHNLAWFMHWEVKDRRGEPAWSTDDVKLFHSRLTYATNEVEDFELSEAFIRRLDDKFLPWLHDRDPYCWAIAAFITHTGVRRSEAYGANASLEDGTIVRKPDGRVRISRKKDKGRQRHTTYHLMPKAEEVLEEWLRLREELGVTDPALFLTTQSHTRWDDESQTLNRILRLRARESGFFKGTCNDDGDKATGEIKFFSTHTIGRRCFITRNSSAGLDEDHGMKLSGHKDPKQYRKYVRVSADDASRIAAGLLEAKANGAAADQGVKVDVKDLFRQLSELPQEERQELGLMLLRGNPS